MSDETKKVDDGGPAFPDDRSQVGMSLRDWFAGMALQGWNNYLPPAVSTTRNGDIAEWAYSQADAMIERRKK